MRVCHSGQRKVSVARIGLILEKIYDIFVGTNETVRNIRVSVLSGCPQSGVPLYFQKHKSREKILKNN